jgi:hypothetical protein
MAAWKRLHALLATPLPKYALMPIPLDYTDAKGQPTPIVREIYSDLLKPQGLRFEGEACLVVRSAVAPGLRDGEPPPGTVRGFWFCPLHYSPPPAQQAAIESPLPAAYRQAFDLVERHCPRFFPPGRGIDRRSDEILTRAYDSDTRLLSDPSGRVYLKYFRALNPSFIGTVDDIRQGRLDLPCDKLPGRYRPLWQDSP